MLTMLLLLAQVGQKQDMQSPAELLHQAALRGQTSSIEMLLKLGADVNSAGKDGETPLHDACLKGHFETARLLLDRGAKIEARDERGATPLHDAALGGSTKLIELLLERKADIRAHDSAGLTALDYAVKIERNDAIRRLRAASEKR
jgi:ankyrin repeat protein